ncbi:hypothetical protein JB92DRAFT_2817851 [Gautieria morchelliformis]|nr:hypothetical protein JB92DRAFT_2817851 [Gautieria morchelliformis]
MNLDDLVLSGALFSKSRSPSPVRRSPSRSRSRSASPDPLFPSNDDFTDSDVSASPSRSAPAPTTTSDVQMQTHMRPGRTGVKGVIRDHNESVSLRRAKQAQEIKDANRRMERMALTARTFAEDEEERVRERAREEGGGSLSPQIVMEKPMFERAGRTGHLREIGEAGFLNAIDGEEDGTWVVLHIYDPALARCHDVDAVLARLARQYPLTKFLRARAAAVGFASLKKSSPSASGSGATPNSSTHLATLAEDTTYSDDEADAYLYNDDEEDEEQVLTDLDMLPTVLVYRAGQIVHNWIRVDWEAEAWGRGTRADKDKKNPETNGSSVEALLRGHNIIQSVSNGNCGFSSDDEEETLEFAPGDSIADDDLFDL